MMNMTLRQQIVLLCCFCLMAGCASTECNTCKTDEKSIWKAMTLMAWQHETAEDKNEADDKDKDKAKEPEAKEPSEIVTDRPDFTEASSTVGKGRIQLESGYTYSRNRDQDVRNGHSYPEALFRIGMFADWFEWRIGQNYSSTKLTISSVDGMEDLYVGVKLALTEQKSFLPESALVLQATVPTGADQLSTNKSLPGFNYLFGWDVVPDKWTAAGSLQANMATNGSGDTYVEVAQSFTIGYSWTEKLGSYTEVYGIEPCGAREPGVGPEYYANGGFTYKFTPNFQYDIRAGVGLNKYSDDFFMGTGFAVRY
jgi:hypothetical protein